MNGGMYQILNKMYKKNQSPSSSHNVSILTATQIYNQKITRTPFIRDSGLPLQWESVSPTEAMRSHLNNNVVVDDKCYVDMARVAIRRSSVRLRMIVSLRVTALRGIVVRCAM
jgi:hypothetical protein